MENDQQDPRSENHRPHGEGPHRGRGRIRVQFLGKEMKGRNLFERFVVFVGGIILFVLGFFFFAVAAVIGLVLISGFIARWWWAAHKLKKAAAASQDLEGDYVVVERDVTPHGRRLEGEFTREDQERR